MSYFNSRNQQRVLSNDELHSIAPSLFAQSASADRSERYRFVPTIDVLDALRSEGFQPVSVKESRSMTDEGKPFVKHHVRLRREQDLGIKLTDFDTVLPEIALTNSHNGTSGFILDAALHRLVCSNGLIAAQSQGSLRFRHSGSDDLAGRIIEGAYEIVEDFPLLADSVKEWSGIELNRDQQMAFAAAAIPLRFEADEDGNYPVSPSQILVPKRFGDHRKDLFTTFNITQEHLIRGGVRTGIKNGRRMTSRKITSVDTDMKLNKALWTLASEMSKLVQ